MQEKSIFDAAKLPRQASPELAKLQTTTAEPEFERLLGSLRLNFTQPECTDGNRNG